MRRLLIAFIMFGALGSAAIAGEPRIEVRKSATCGCCAAWIGHLKKSGFGVDTKNLSFEDLTRFKRQQGIRPKHASCHTARVGGYVIEGHVPAREIKRLLREKPDAIGLSVPGMPMGSPGMEDGSYRDAYSVLLIKKDGTTEVYARYPARK